MKIKPFKLKFLKKIFYYPFIFSIYLVFIFVALEVSLKLYFNKPILKFVDYRVNDYILIENKSAISFDDDIGWIHKPYFSNSQMKFLEYGIRSNGDESKKLEMEGILVTGSSFTAGSGVKDKETWPAVLENKINMPVHNTAVGGYAVDQIIMRAKMLIDILKPIHVIMDMQDVTIQWSAYSSRTYPKPYFKLENKKLVRHNKPVPQAIKKGYLKNKEGRHGFLRKVLLNEYVGYSFFIHKLMTTFFNDVWLYDQWNVNKIEKDIDMIKLNCELIKEFSNYLKEKEISLTLVSIPSGQEFEKKKKGKYLYGVESCIAKSDINMVEFFGDIIEDVDAKKITSFDIWAKWGDPPRAVGHPNSSGQKYFAEKIFQNIKNFH